MHQLVQLLYKVLRPVVKPFVGTRKGQVLGKVPLVAGIYRWLFNLFTSEKYQPLLINGYKIYLHTGRYKGLRDTMAQALLFRGVHEPYTTLLFDKLVKERMTVVDIGANIGYFTLIAAGLVGEKGRVFAFEPEPQNYAVLVKNVAANGFNNVTTRCMAVSDTTGNAPMFIDDEDSGSHSLVKTAQRCTRSTMVDVTCLDDFISDAGGTVDIVKIDAGGTEVSILSGMYNTIRANADLKIFTEFWLPGLESAGVTPQEYWDKLTQSGFNFIYLVNEDKQNIELLGLEAILRYCQPTGSRPQNWANLLCAKSPITV